MQEAEQVAARPRNAAAGTWRGFLVTSTTSLGSASPGHQSPPMVPPPSYPPPAKVASLGLLLPPLAAP